MPDAYTRKHYDFETLPRLASPRRQLGLKGVALGLIRLPAGEGYTFTHSHEKQEEVYIVIVGSGEIYIDGETLGLVMGDIVRVDASARRALRARDEDLLVICAGGIPLGYPKDPQARYLIDDGIPHYDDIPPWYSDDPDIARRNEALRQRMLEARERRERGKKGAAG